VFFYFCKGKNNMQLSKLVDKIAGSPTLILNAKANKLKSEGSPVIHLGGGEPHSLTPPDAIASGIEKLKTGKVKYTPSGGIPKLKQAILNHTLKIYSKKLLPENVLVSNGAKQSIFNFLLAVIDEGDEVIFPAPYWVSYPEMAKLARGVPVIVNPPENSFEPSFESIKNAVTKKTKAILINSPNNPSGAVYSNKLIEEIVSFCENKKIYLLMDDIYRQLTFENIKPAVCYDYAKNTDNLMVINGISKAYGMTGFRIGWALGSSKIIAAMTKIQAQTVSCPSDLSQVCAVGALEGNQKCIQELVSHLEENRKILLSELAKIKKVKVIEPQGTFYCLADFSAYEKNSDKLAEYLIEKAMVVTIPGSGFGMEGHLRISYCGAKQDVYEGINRIRKVLDGEI
jgi:aspartate aminotransferase